MKKLLTMAIALLISGALQAQNDAVKQEKKSFLVLHAGPTIPVGDFNSTNTANSDAGFAKTGYTINLNYGYQFEKNAGLTANVFYNGYNTHNFSMTYLEGTSSSGTLTLDMDHWKVYGITAGPMLTFEIGHGILADCKLMGGIANAHSPKLIYKGRVLTNGDDNWAATILGGVNLRMNAGGNLFVFANTDYMYLKPKFSYTYTSSITDQQVTKNTSQKMSVVNVSAGIGINF